MCFQGHVYLYSLSHRSFCGQFFQVSIFKYRTFCNCHSSAKSSKLPLICVFQITQPLTLYIINDYFHQKALCPFAQDRRQLLPVVMDVRCNTCLNKPVFNVNVFQPPKVESLNGLLLGYRIYYRELDYDTGSGTDSKTIQNPSALRAEITRKPVFWTL